jgi:hypothetical protein
MPVRSTFISIGDQRSLRSRGSFRHYVESIGIQPAFLLVTLLKGATIEPMNGCYFLRRPGGDFYEIREPDSRATITLQHHFCGVREVAEKTLSHLLCRTKLRPLGKSRKSGRDFYLHSSQFVSELSSIPLKL